MWDSRSPLFGTALYFCTPFSTQFDSSDDSGFVNVGGNNATFYITE